MNHLLSGLGAATLGFVAAYVAQRAAVALRHLRNAWLMRRGVDGLRDAAFSNDLVTASALLSLLLGAAIATFAQPLRAILLGGLVPPALYLAFVSASCAHQALTLEQL